jgi:hypothetical protein
VLSSAMYSSSPHDLSQLALIAVAYRPSGKRVVGPATPPHR